MTYRISHQAYFYVEATKKTGMGGFVVYNPDEELYYMASWYYGMDWPRNYMAEVQSLVDLATGLY